jgi:hypothetical protein
MPLSREPETQFGENAKFLYATKTNNPTDPIQVAFAVTDEQGTEQIVTGEVPSSSNLYSLCVENGWLREPRAISISQRQRRAAAS